MALILNTNYHELNTNYSKIKLIYPVLPLFQAELR